MMRVQGGALKRWLVRILAAVGALALTLLIAAGIYFAAVVRGGFAARDQPSALEARLARAARSLAVPARAKSLKNPLPASDEVIARGRHHWADHCALCHANDGSGDTPIGRNLYPKAPDMRAAATQGLSDGELYYIIENGIRLSGMPAWGERAREDDEDSWALVAFIRHLPKLGPDEVRKMEALNPKSAEDKQEEEQEENFLGGGSSNPQPH